MGWPYEWEDDDDEFELSENYPLCRVFSTETFPSEKPWPMHILNKLIRFASELMYISLLHAGETSKRPKKKNIF